MIIHILATETGCEVQISRFDSVKIEDKEIETHLAVMLERIRDCFINDNPRFLASAHHPDP